MTTVTMHDLADELYGREDYYTEPGYKQFIFSCGLQAAPPVAVNSVRRSEIDLLKVNECAARICELILEQKTALNSNKDGVIKYTVDYSIISMNSLGAVMLLCNSFGLSTAPYWVFGAERGKLVAYQQYKLPTGQITRKQAAQLLKQKVRNKLADIYEEYPTLEFEKLMGLKHI